MNRCKKLKRNMYVAYHEFLFQVNKLKYYSMSRKLYKILRQKNIDDFFSMLNENYFRMEICDFDLPVIKVLFYHNKTPLLKIMLNRTDFTYKLMCFSVTPWVFENKNFDLSFLFDLMPKMHTFISLIETLSIEPRKANDNTAVFQNAVSQMYPEERYNVLFYNELNHIEITSKKRERFIIRLYSGGSFKVNPTDTIKILYFPFNKNKNIFYSYSRKSVKIKNITQKETENEKL